MIPMKCLCHWKLITLLSFDQIIFLLLLYITNISSPHNERCISNVSAREIFAVDSHRRRHGPYLLLTLAFLIYISVARNSGFVVNSI